MIATDVYVDDAYATYWDTIEADMDSLAPVAVCDLDEPFGPDTPQDIIDAYTEFSSMSED